MADHVFDDHTATVATSTILRALNHSALTKDYSADMKKEFATALSAVFNDETVKRSLAKVMIQEIDYLRDTDPEKHLPDHHTRPSIVKLD